MQTKIIGILMFICAFTLPMSGQTQDLTLTGTGGGMQHTGDFYLSYSIGEPFAVYKNNTDRWITEGYLQPDSIDLTTGTKDILTSSVLNIYPNPANGVLYVELKNGFNDGTIQVENTLGQTLIVKEIAANNIQTIFIDQLDYGIYFLRLQHRNSSSIMTSFIKI